MRNRYERDRYELDRDARRTLINVALFDDDSLKRWSVRGCGALLVFRKLLVFVVAQQSV